MNKKIKTLLEKIQNAKSIAISGHKNPDGDALCSALAIMEFIRINFNKPATVIYDGNIPKSLEKVPLRESAHFYGHIPENEKYDLYILVDYGTKKQLGGAEIFIDKSDFIIEFDHHFNPDKAGILCFDNTEKAATSQILFDIMRKTKLKINKNVIDLLTIALITDTGNFRYVRHSDVFKDATALVEAGANIPELANLLQNKDKKTVLVESKAASNAEFFMRGRLAVAVINKADYRKLDGRGEIVLSLLSKISGVEYVVLFKEQKENQIGISFRSKNTSIKTIAEKFGGGGHECASGAVVNEPLETIKTKVISAFKGM